jgi:hypothetical protein
LSDEALEDTQDIDSEVEGAEEHHEGGSSDETLVEVFAFAVVDEDPDCDDIEEERYAVEKRLEEERDELCFVERQIVVYVRDWHHIRLTGSGSLQRHWRRELKVSKPDANLYVLLMKIDIRNGW